MVQIVPDRGPSEQATKNGVRPYDMIHAGRDERIRCPRSCNLKQRGVRNRSNRTVGKNGYPRSSVRSPDGLDTTTEPRRRTTQLLPPSG